MVSQTTLSIILLTRSHPLPNDDIVALFFFPLGDDDDLYLLDHNACTNNCVSRISW